MRLKAPSHTSAPRMDDALTARSASTDAPMPLRIIGKTNAPPRSSQEIRQTALDLAGLSSFQAAKQSAKGYIEF